MIALCYSLFAYDSVVDAPFTVKSSVDWQAEVVRIELAMPIKNIGNHSRSRAEDVFAVDTVRWLRQGLAEIVVDYQTTMTEQWQEMSTLGRAHLALRLQEMLSPGRAAFSEDFSRFSASYSLRLYPDLVDLWSADTLFQPKLPAQIDISDTLPYTGVLIYARGQRPIHGEPQAHSTLTPALFPRLFDEEMKLLLDIRYVDPVYLKRWGIVRYYSGNDLDSLADRIGNFPLRTRASAYWGKNRSDIMLPNAAVANLNSSLQGRRALRQGRVVVLIDAS